MLEIYALPGQVNVGSDSHTPHVVAIGCIAFGIGTTDVFKLPGRPRHCSSGWRRASDDDGQEAADDDPMTGRLMARRSARDPGDRYRWVALTNTTAAMFMATLDGSIVIIALPAIFRGIHLDPLAAGNISYLLWMIMGYRLVQAVLVVTLGRFGDMFGRVKIYNAGFAVFTVASVLLSFDPFQGGHGALWLIGWRVLQAIGGSMLMANSAAILTDAFPPDRRGFALGTNQVAGLAGQFIGLVAGGLLAAIDWRAVFWVNVPVGVFGTLWAYRKLRDNGERHRGRIDWWGNVTFAVGLGAVLIGITTGIQPYRARHMGWVNPAVLGLLAGGVGAARGIRRDRDQDRRADVPAQPVPHPGVHGRATSRAWRCPSPAAACSSC